MHSSPASLTTAVMNAIDSARARQGAPARISVTLRAGGHDVVSIEPDDQHDAASTMKLPVLIAAYRQRDAGRLDLSREIAVANDFTSRTGNRFTLDRDDDSDEQPWQRVDSTARLDWLCRRMIIRSSNLATDVVWEQVGSEAVTDVIDLAGATGVRVERAIGDYAARPAGFRNFVTTAGLAQILTALASDRLASPATSAELLDVLAANEVATDVRAGLPSGTWVAHKNGWIDDTVLDAALVRPDDAREFILCVAVSAEWPNEDAHQLIRGIAAQVWARRHQL